MAIELSESVRQDKPQKVMGYDNQQNPHQVGMKKTMTSEWCPKEEKDVGDYS